MAPAAAFHVAGRKEVYGRIGERTDEAEHHLQTKRQSSGSEHHFASRLDSFFEQHISVRLYNCGTRVAHSSHMTEIPAFGNGDGHCRPVSLWMFSAPHDARRVVFVPPTTMMSTKKNNRSVTDATVAACLRASRLHRDYVLYQLVTEDAQSVAEKELGRTLTDEELGTVEHKIGDYIDWDEAMTFCIRQRIAEEL